MIKIDEIVKKNGWEKNFFHFHILKNMSKLHCLNWKSHVVVKRKLPLKWHRPGFASKLRNKYAMIFLYWDFLEQFKINSKIEGKWQKFPIYPGSHRCIDSLSHYQQTSCTPVARL